MSSDSELVSRLGRPEQVADAAALTYRRRSFLGRHPAAAFLVFAVSPIVSLVFLAGICICGMWLFDEACNRMGYDTEQELRNLKQLHPVVAAVMPYVVSLLVVLIPSGLASVFYCKLAMRFGLGGKWIQVSCAMLAVLALMPICTARLSDIPGKSRLAVGYWNPLYLEHLLGSVVWCLCSPQQLLQFLVPLAIGWWFLQRQGRWSRRQLAHLL